MKTHEIKEQSRVAQLTARELAAQSHFEVNPQVKLEPEDYLANDSILEEEEEEKELENGSIVYDHNGRAYRYYASESAYQAATGGPPEAPMNEPPFQWACHPEHQQTSSSGSSSNTGVFNRNPPLTSLPFQSGLGNAAPAALSSTMPTDHENGQRAPFEQWMPGRNGTFDISSGVSLNRPPALGNAGTTI
ncbi:hypothetical protein QFC19_008773 [Naganishia cerealis]|uniref:Uncharacterized protein n=1 Tax=Naganishia cerealis TaxID=610337 RepID=A0ACC2V041_9TREE|nr:hypothetical protein QFC19_008773 [Naganishia cerealis]